MSSNDNEVHEGEIHEGEVIDNFPFSFREFDDAIREHLLSWINSSEALDPKIKKQILTRLSGLRVKFQVLMIELQKKIFKDFVLDIETEEATRTYLRSQLPYMSNKERVEVMKNLASINEDRMKRLETQVTGWDFINTTAMSLETLSEIRASEELVDEVKKLAPERRARLLLTANEIIKEINSISESDS